MQKKRFIEIPNSFLDIMTIGDFKQALKNEKGHIVNEIFLNDEQQHNSMKLKEQPLDKTIFEVELIGN